MSRFRTALRLNPFLAVTLLGYASGLPLVLTGSTLQAWLKSAGTGIGLIGLFSLAGLPYTLKFLWSPLLDRFQLPFGGRRRGWILVTQLALVLLLAGMAGLDLQWYAQSAGLLGRLAHQSSLILMVLLAFGVAFASASQDIATDAYRTELLSSSQAGLGASLAVGAYRVGMLVAGAFALWLSDRMSWRVVYLVMAACMVPGILATLLSPEPALQGRPPRRLREAVVEPFKEFWARKGSLEVLLFITIYKAGDTFNVNLMVPFLLDKGFSRTEIGFATKFVGLCALIGGGIIGGFLMKKWSLWQALWRFGLIQAAANLLPLALALSGKSYALMFCVLGAENFMYGLGTAAFTAFLMQLCNRSYTATQFALLSSLGVTARVFLVAPGGFVQKAIGWPGYFAVGVCLALPGLLLLQRFIHWEMPGLEEAEAGEAGKAH